MAEIMTIRARDNRSIVTAVNVVKRLDTAIKGLQNDIQVKKDGVADSVQALFDTDMTGEDPKVYSNFKIETTKITVVDGVEVEVPDGVVQCQMKVVRKELSAEENALLVTAGIDVATAAECRAEGADTFVAGTSFYRAADRAKFAADISSLA